MYNLSVKATPCIVQQNVGLVASEAVLFCQPTACVASKRRLTGLLERARTVDGLGIDRK